MSAVYDLPEYKPAYNYTFRFWFETRVEQDRAWWTIWGRNHWQWSIYMSIIYVVCLQFGVRLMQKREPFQVNGLLAIWNGLLAVFSIMGVVRMAPEFFTTLTEHGFQSSICQANYASSVSGYWAWAFARSKIFELGDTAFLILRKRPVIFLHWYHHVTVFIYTWHAYKDHTASGRWFIFMNFVVHSCMYSYFFFSALRCKIPKTVSASITGLQLVQMILGVYISVTVYRLKLKNEFCQQKFSNLYFCFAIYFSYFLLFLKFFYSAYLKNFVSFNKQKFINHFCTNICYSKKRKSA